MIIPQIHTEYREFPVVFAAGGEEIYGILAEPLRAARDTGVILLTGGGFIPMMHRNRMWVRLARRRGIPRDALRLPWRR